MLLSVYSGDKPIPREELTLGGDLYTALQGFYNQHPHFKERPLYITGESYAGGWTLTTEGLGQRPLRTAVSAARLLATAVSLLTVFKSQEPTMASLRS